MEMTEIAGYRILRTLGAGGMGQVFLVEHPRLPRRDALKLLDAGVSRNSEFKARFQREADLLAQLSHPNIVTLYDRGEYDGRLWATMEFVEGTDAGQLLESTGPLSPTRVMSLVASAGSALDYAWRKQRITHRDVKPANILLAIDDHDTVEAVKLADFGIAKAAEETTTLTSTGITVGTLAYMSPEAIEGAEIDNRSDIYSLGCTAFHLFSGQAPFTGKTMTALMSAHLNGEPPSLSKFAPHLPATLDSVFTRVLSREPDSRYSSCAEFVAALSDALDGRTTPLTGPAYAQTIVGTHSVPGRHPHHRSSSRRNRWITAVSALAATAVLAVGGAAAYAYFQQRDETPTASAPITQTTVTTHVTSTPSTTTAPAIATVYEQVTPTEEPEPVTVTPEPVEGQECGLDQFGDISADGTLFCSAENGAWTDRTHQSRPAVTYGTECSEPGARARISGTDAIATCESDTDGTLTWGY
ncbi:serine/threonine protein kinase [Gordonia sp. QH-12]|uniref:serine/threonine protein kinase n=1 Tax=Gordonia TaxID=2053 RepID=UPI0007838CB4|nr:serine/threonine-protein kinase [Gordonia sp. QH-12]KXT58332.1 serine/threonine protein kinase [Gordonia sp. QH-12]